MAKGISENRGHRSDQIGQGRIERGSGGLQWVELSVRIREDVGHTGCCCQAHSLTGAEPVPNPHRVESERRIEVVWRGLGSVEVLGVGAWLRARMAGLRVSAGSRSGRCGGAHPLRFGPRGCTDSPSLHQRARTSEATNHLRPAVFTGSRHLFGAQVADSCAPPTGGAHSGSRWSWTPRTLRCGRIADLSWSPNWVGQSTDLLPFCLFRGCEWLVASHPAGRP